MRGTGGGLGVGGDRSACTCLEQQRIQQQKLTDLESRSRRNNMLFGVAEGEEGNSVPQFIVELLRSELPLPQELDLKIQRAHRSGEQKPPSRSPTETYYYQLPGVYNQGHGTERSLEKRKNPTGQQKTILRPRVCD
ncbi:hypothetical protein VZT92_012528 [Zoarces viviparus]|uniref:Uncharacterized protein n=1 Tax=Zoarces viviparus TaxID=48416 RepID=A0AAW1F2E4_ZOAVI